MLKNLKILIIMALIWVISGCATPYRGPGPNFKVKNKEEAEKEINKFTMDYSFFSRGISMDTNMIYEQSSVLPIIRDVSPAGYEDVSRGRTLESVGVVLSLVGLLGLLNVGGLYINNPGNFVTVAGGVLTVGGLGITFWGDSMIRTGVNQYNYDLRQKFQSNFSQSSSFSPSVAVSWKY